MSLISTHRINGLLFILWLDVVPGKIGSQDCSVNTEVYYNEFPVYLFFSKKICMAVF